MTTKSNAAANYSARYSNRPGALFGVPLGDLGWFSSLLMACALGFAAFFATTFAGIVTILILNTHYHHHADFSLAYRRFGLTAGAIVLTCALLYVGSLWLRRQLRKS